MNTSTVVPVPAQPRFTEHVGNGTRIIGVYVGGAQVAAAIKVARPARGGGRRETVWAIASNLLVTGDGAGVYRDARRLSTRSSVEAADETRAREWLTLLAALYLHRHGV